MTDFNTYLTTEKFAPGTKFSHYNIATAVVDDDGSITQTKRGVLQMGECRQNFPNLQSWLDTLPITNPEEDHKLNIEVPNNENIPIVPPEYILYQPTGATPYEIVKSLNEKNRVAFKFKIGPSLTMLHARAKIALLELDSKECWQNLKLTDPITWQTRYEGLSNNVLEAFMNIQNAFRPDVMPYVVHNPKYPRVFVKFNNKMCPIYHIEDGSNNVYVDGRFGKSWTSVGLPDFPEFWISWNGMLVRQLIHFYLPYKFTQAPNNNDFTQFTLALIFRETPDTDGCLSNGKQVMNIKTRMYIQPWQVV